MPDDALPSNPPPDSSEPGDESSRTTDWRLVAIVAIALALLTAVYVNRRFYGKPPPPEPPPPDGAAETPPPPPMSPAAQYAAVKRARELMAAEEVFRAGDKEYIIARPPSRVRDKDRPDEIAGVLPGRLFDITQRIEGLSPTMLHRRLVFGRQPVSMFADTFPPLGSGGSPKMLFKPASAEGVAEEMPDASLVIGVAVGDETKAYPLRFAHVHDVINDTVGGKPILLCLSALAVNASAMERPLSGETPDVFGSAGLLYQGAVVAYDEKTRSLWSPLLRKCIAGARAGETLSPVPTILTRWETWRMMHPDTSVLTGTEPALNLPYGGQSGFPTPDYPSNSMVFYPAYGFDIADSPMNVKTAVFGVTGPDGKTVKAYAAPLLRKTTEAFEDDIGGAPVVIAYDSDAHTLTATDADGKPLFVESMFWMNWFGAHSDTEVWRKDEMPYPFAENADPAAKLPESLADPTSFPAVDERPNDAPATIPAPP